MVHNNISENPIDKRHWNSFVVIGLVAILIRLLFNFSNELISGINGGYYPYQVKTVLTTGRLAFNDMPLYFYLNALVVWIINIFGIEISNTLIINVLKVIDSISLPMLLIPLYIIFKDKLYNKGNSIVWGLLMYATLSASPLILMGDLQKNAFGIPFIFLVLLSFITYQHNYQKKYLLFALMSVLLAGAIHMGVLVLVMMMLGVGLIVHNQWKGLLYSVLLVVAVWVFVFVIDPARAARLQTFWLVLFEKPALLQGPMPLQDLANVIFSVALSISALIKVQTSKEMLSANEILIVRIMAIVLLILSFPLTDIEYFRRFLLLSFIPQVLLIWFLLPIFKEKTAKMIGIMLIAISMISLLQFTVVPKPPSISIEAYKDLSKMCSELKLDNRTIIVARHGLEWWVGFALGTKISQDKAIDSDFLKKYSDILILKQKAGINTIPGTRFHEPVAPISSEIVYSSKYFEASRLKNE